MGSFDYGALAATASTGFEPLPVGQYDVEVTGAEYKVASTGKPMYKVEFTIDSGPNKGRKVWTNLVLSPDNPNAVGAFFGKMRSLGLDADFFAGVSGEDAEGIICQALIGATATIGVKHRDWNGQTQNEVDRIVGKAGGAPVSATVPDVAPAASRPAPDLPPGI